MHKTNAGERRKALQREAGELARNAKANRLRAEAEALKDQSRLEDLTVWTLEKVKSTKKGSRSYHYWMATWREGGKTRNVHLGSYAKMDAEGSPAEGQKGEDQGPGDQTLILSAKIVADMEPYLAKRNAEELSSLSLSSHPQRLNRCLSPGTRCHRHSQRI